ncbi:DUF2283 domain-containing protein [Methylomonas koyamae]|uniref:DUF2283 domain-containing protein n=1 Tax=Methylomonas koyamae TaxID=702114 RepID=UPI002872E330|nr:DUF2283 domain-containing protein [Methylomonas koyamae]WNB74274.1 DUF2283 domain-containing protein [Methylomonas koyamae]
MKLNYDPETDSLYIHLRDIPSVDSREISDGLILDFDADGVAVGIDIQHAGKMADIHFLTAMNIPYHQKNRYVFWFPRATWEPSACPRCGAIRRSAANLNYHAARGNQENQKIRKSKAFPVSADDF